MKTHLLIHHSQTADSLLTDVSAIRDWHVRVQGWRDIGYNWILDRVKGRVEIIMGRFPDEDGAHAGPRFNKCSEGIVCVGNYDAVTPPEDLLISLRKLVLWRAKERGTIPLENVIGHWEAQVQDGIPSHQRKSCPGRLFDMAEFRRSLQGGFDAIRQGIA